MIAGETRLVRVALQFLTRLPVGKIDAFDASEIARAAKYFPLAGGIIGAISAAALLASAIVLPQPVPIVVALAAAVFITGALHEDGLADSADGLFGGTTPERRLEIMKDSRIGTFGILALLIALGFKAAALIPLDPMSAARTLVVAHAGARLAAVAAMWALPYAGDPALAKSGPLATAVTSPELAIACMIAVAIAVTCLTPATLIAGFIAGLLAAACVTIVAKRRIGGITGDVLGATEQAFEAAFLVAASAVIAGPG